MAMNPRLLRPLATFDPDAAAYLRAVEAADGQALETPVKRAVDDFFRGTKADGTFSALKAACLLCGARTLAGALVPLVGTAPTNVADGFVSGDYTRGGAAPGLTGDGTSYLDSGRANNADPLNDRHYSVYLTSYNANNPQVVFGSMQLTFPGTLNICLLSADTASLFHVSGNLAPDRLQFTPFNSLSPAFAGATRSSSAGFSARAGGTTASTTSASVRTTALNEFVFARNNNGSVEFRSAASIAFYSIGESLDLALLDNRVTALVTAIGAAV